MLLEGSMDCIALHKRGLYCAGRVSYARSVFTQLYHQFEKLAPFET